MDRLKKLSRKGQLDIQKITERELCVTYIVYVKTGDRPKAGTDANVYLILHGDGNQTKEKKLDIKFHNDFERGQEDRYTIPNTKLERVEMIEIWRDNKGIGADWFIDTIVVENEKTGEKLPFPVFRWIKAHYHYKFPPYDTCLPQNETRRESPKAFFRMAPVILSYSTDQRRMELEEKRVNYQYETKGPGFPMQIKYLPRDEEFSFDYVFDIFIAKHKMLMKKRVVKIASSKWKCVKDLENLYNFSSFTRPSELDRWSDDVKFGRQRLAGVNSTELRLCREYPHKLGVIPEMLEPFLEGRTFDVALKDKKIFIIDYEILANCPTADGLVACAPIALFFERNDGNLVPIAIQLYQEKSPENPVFLPSDSKYTWIIAKMWFNNADAAIHQAISHLGSTHLIMEGFAIAANRNLSLSHPIFKLLAPHFLYLIAINSRALTTLLSRNGYIDQTMTLAVEGTMEVLKRAKTTWRLDVEGTLPAELKKRGVDDLNLLPNYHSRNDALLLYDSIRRYVENYVDVYYVTKSDFTDDEELQAWRMELVNPESRNGLGIQGVPGENDQFTSKEQLVLVLTSIIYTCSVGHALVNFKQYDEYGFPPNYPSKLYGTPPKDKKPRTERDIVDAIMSKDGALNLMIVTSILSKRATNALGDFEVNYVYDPKAVAVVQEFRKDLKTISDTIRARNEERTVPYTCLDPKEIPNSISI